jgi:Fur family ferric uptake transcriptional regulator
MKQDLIEELKKIVKSKGLKYTKQREIVLDVIASSNRHLDTDEIHRLISDNHPDEKIGIATVYRSLSFLEEVGLVSSISIGIEPKKYELSMKEHHDHLICQNCGKIVEFCDEGIEKSQEKIAKKMGFKLTSHSMYLYGICQDCR